MSPMTASLHLIFISTALFHSTHLSTEKEFNGRVVSTIVVLVNKKPFMVCVLFTEKYLFYVFKLTRY